MEAGPDEDYETMDEEEEDLDDLLAPEAAKTEKRLAATLLGWLQGAAPVREVEGAETGVVRLAGVHAGTQNWQRAT